MTYCVKKYYLIYTQVKSSNFVQKQAYEWIFDLQLKYQSTIACGLGFTIACGRLSRVGQYQSTIA